MGFCKKKRNGLHIDVPVTPSTTGVRPSTTLGHGWWITSDRDIFLFIQELHLVYQSEGSFCENSTSHLRMRHLIFYFWTDISHLTQLVKKEKSKL